MLQVFRTQSNGDNWYNYYLKNDGNKLGIVFCGDGDLYFCSFDRCQESEFLITKENMAIYNLFCQLFDAFEKVKVFNVSKSDLLQCDNEEEQEALYNQVYERNKKLKKDDIYKKLYKSQKITWISDNSISFDYLLADAMTIIKEPGCYRLKFTFYEDNFPHLRSIRIRNARSRYKPFNMLMMDFFNNLQNYNPDYHQIHIEEYLLNETKKLVKQ